MQTVYEEPERADDGNGGKEDAPERLGIVPHLGRAGFYRMALVDRDILRWFE